MTVQSRGYLSLFLILVLVFSIPFICFKYYIVRYDKVTFRSICTGCIFKQDQRFNSAVYGKSKYHNITQDEYERKLLKSTELGACAFKYRPCSRNSRLFNIEGEIVQKIDWREKAFVSPVGDQKRCNGCWAFALVSSMETMNSIRRSTADILSVQQLIDCARYTNGCRNGNPVRAANFLCDSSTPLTKASSYPLMLISENCKLIPNSGIKISDYSTECNVDEWRILSIVANHGPVIVAVNAMPWKDYLGGVIVDHCDNDWASMNHVVLIVGYDLSADIPHYIVKNSFGSDFGDDGYVRLAFGANTCGLANSIMFLNVENDF